MEKLSKYGQNNVRLPNLSVFDKNPSERESCFSSVFRVYTLKRQLSVKKEVTWTQIPTLWPKVSPVTCIFTKTCHLGKLTPSFALET